MKAIAKIKNLVIVKLKKVKNLHLNYPQCTNFKIRLHNKKIIKI